MQDQENRPYRPDDSVHPAIVRLTVELEAARHGIGVLGELEDAGRERVVAELLSAVPDVASRAAHEAGAERAVATIQGFGGTGSEDHEPTTALWDRLVLTAVEAAVAVDAPAAVDTDAVATAAASDRAAHHATA